jgi:hypothetical protein
MKELSQAREGLWRLENGDAERLDHDSHFAILKNQNVFNKHELSENESAVENFHRAFGSLEKSELTKLISEMKGKVSKERPNHCF